MLKLLKSLFIEGDDNYDVKMFNLVQLIYFAGLLFVSIFIYICIPDPIYLYMTELMCFVIITSIIDVNRTGSKRKCIIIISVVSNFVYLPLCYYGYGKLICCVPVYFVLGILYTVLLLNGKLGFILSTLESIYLCAVIIFIGNRFPRYTAERPALIDFIAITIAIVIVGVLAAVAIKTRVNQYDVEYNIMQETKLKVIDAYNSKDIFFANTSHEIRTPLNAIVGTVNLLLDEDLDNQVRDNVYNILNSCNALLSIIDELMTLSNTDGSNVSVMEARYSFSEMISDIINMISVRLMESGVQFFVEIDKDLPHFLIGDGGKVRQLFINVLNNAVKYTKEGKIVLRIKGEVIDDGILNIMAEVEDTGIGIKEEAIGKIFSDYNRDEEDTEKRVIEGTGLGLSLCKELVEKMDGSISVESTYHVGSTFYFNIHQKLSGEEPIAEVYEKDNTKTIIFERDKERAEALKASLDALSIISVVATDRMHFETLVISGNYQYVCIAAERYAENKRFIDRKVDSQRVIILSDITKSVQTDRNCYILIRPAHIINVAMAYNNENNDFSRQIIQKGGFTCPTTTILVIDDNITNLEVASGLLRKYEATIFTANSGIEGINIIENMHVDIVFLDYMMPEMNGIDTLYTMRALNNEQAKNVPVVALTANVVSGAKEMFMDAGFCDYISKPIDVNKLEKTLRKFLPRDQIRIKI